MRPHLLLLMLPVAALAQDGEPVYATDRSLLRRPLVPSEEACPTWIDSRDFRVARGEATGPLRDNAIALAQQDGVQRLSGTLCDGQERSPRCLAALRNIAPVGPGEWQKRGVAGGWACASVAIEEKVLNSQQHELGALSDALAALANVVREAAGDQAVQLLPPRWQDTGCPAGEVGAHLLIQLRQHLAGIALLDTDQPTGEARQVRLDIATAGGKVAVAAVSRVGDEGPWVGLDAPVVSFAADLFQLRPDDARTCPAEDDLALPGGERPGSGDLSVQLFMASPDGLFCDGEQATPRVELSAPARLRLFTVQADGQGFLVWPHQVADDRVYSPAEAPTLPAFTATRSFDGTDSRLIVAAFPADSSDLAPPAFCRLDEPLDVASLTGAALASAAYHVAAAGERLCLERGDVTVADTARAHAGSAIQRAPICARIP